MNTINFSFHQNVLVKYCFFLILDTGFSISCSKESVEDIAQDSCQQSMLSKYEMSPIQKELVIVLACKII